MATLLVGDVETPRSVPPATLRRAMGHFATGVTVVTAHDHAGVRFGTTANSVTSLSLEPPLLLVCLMHGSETLRAITATRAFTVNILRDDQRHLSDRFAKAAHPETWEGVEHRTGAHGPVLEGAIGTLECTADTLVAAGDHTIVIGHVRAAEHPDEHVPPLVYYRGGYTALEAPASA